MHLHANRKKWNRNLVIKMEIGADKGHTSPSTTCAPKAAIIFLYDFITSLISFAECRIAVLIVAEQ